MKNRRSVVWRSALVTCLVFIITLAGLSPAAYGADGSGQPTPPPSGAWIADSVRGALAASGQARVIVMLADPVAVSAPSVQRVPAVARSQESVLAQLSADQFTLYRRYSHVPALAGTITPAALAVLQKQPNVTAILPDEPTMIHLGDSVPALRADIVHSTYNLTGAGVRVAVLDTGIDTNHPDLSNDIVAQHCFTDAGCPPGNTDEGTSAEDDHGHGTNVSGVITSTGTVAPVGFAPDAEIVAVKVLKWDGSGWVSDWIAGMDWVAANQASLNVDIMNMSLGTFALYAGNCDFSRNDVAAAAAQLKALGITVFASSGNQGSAAAMSSPACNGDVVAVGATYDSDMGREPDTGTYQDLFGGSWPACADETTSLSTITCFTNSNAQLELLAPGAIIESTGIGGGLSYYRGTSQAAPTAAGVAALVLQAEPSLTPAQLVATLKNSHIYMVTDPKNSLSFPLIDALNAVKAYLPPDAPSDLAAAGLSDQAIQLGWTDNSDNETGFQIERSPDGMTVWQQVGTVGEDITTFVNSTGLLCEATYHYRVRAVNNDKPSDYSDTASAATLDCPVGRPVLLSPPSKSHLSDTTPALTWNAVTDAASYELWVAPNSEFAGVLEKVTTTATSYTLPFALSEGMYYWKVRAFSAEAVAGRWSRTWVFIIDTTSPPRPPRATSPINGATLSDPTPTFRWTRDAESAGYVFQLAADEGFEIVLLEEALTRPRYDMSAPLLPGTYWWRVASLDAAGNQSAWARAAFTLVPDTAIATPTAEPPATVVPPTSEPPILIPVEPTQPPPPHKPVDPMPTQPAPDGKVSPPDGHAPPNTRHG
jgi:subtilisin family serine protease